jgi:hypothetical protein
MHQHAARQPPFGAVFAWGGPSGTMDASRMRGAMQRRENGALIERVRSAEIELRINSDRGPRECACRVISVALDRAEDYPVSWGCVLIAAPRSGHVDRVAVHARIRQAYARNTNASTASAASNSKRPPAAPLPLRCCSV